MVVIGPTVNPSFCGAARVINPGTYSSFASMRSIVGKLEMLSFLAILDQSNENRAAGSQCGVRTIPTDLLSDVSGERSGLPPVSSVTGPVIAVLPRRGSLDVGNPVDRKRSVPGISSLRGGGRKPSL